MFIAKHQTERELSGHEELYLKDSFARHAAIARHAANDRSPGVFLIYGSDGSSHVETNAAILNFFQKNMCDFNLGRHFASWALTPNCGFIHSEFTKRNLAKMKSQTNHANQQYYFLDPKFNKGSTQEERIAERKCQNHAAARILESTFEHSPLVFINLIATSFDRNPDLMKDPYLGSLSMPPIIGTIRTTNSFR